MAESHSQYSARRLDLPRGPRRLTPRMDPDAFARFSERIARFPGTGRFLAAQTVLVVVWIAINLLAVSLRWDPYPFILLNLAFSTQAAYAAPLILLAQNRQDDRDRVALQEDRVRSRAHQSRYRIPGQGTRRAAVGRRRGGHPGLPAIRARAADRAQRAGIGGLHCTRSGRLGTFGLSARRTGLTE